MDKLLQQAWRAVALADMRGTFWLAIVFGFIVGMSEGLGLVLLAPALSLATGHPLSSTWGAMLPSLNPESLEIFLFSGFAFLTVFSAVARVIGNQASTRLRVNLEFVMRRKLTAGLLDVPWNDYQGLRAGDLVKAIIMEGHNAGWGIEFITVALSSIAVAFLLLACTVFLGGALSLLVCVSGCILAAVLKLLGRKHRQLNTEIAEISSLVGETVEETVSSMKFLRSSGLAGAAKTQLDKLYADYKTRVLQESVYLRIARFVLEIFGVAVVTLVIGIALFMTNIPITQVLVFLMLFYRLVPRLQAAQDGFAQARNLLGWFEVWLTRQSRFPDVTPVSLTALPEFNQPINFRAVEFQYGERGSFRVGPLDLVVQPGACVAFIGKSGSGKTTILDLITGLLNPSRGDVLLGNVSLRALDISALRQGLGLVMQDTPMFHGSILDNICLFEEDPDKERARLCATRAHAWDFIQAQPQGLHTVIGEKGGRLSGGQRQRLALARALYRNPSILMLDEATSNLDDESEMAIVDALAELRGKITIILVSHRPALLQLADLVVTLDGGQVRNQQENLPHRRFPTSGATAMAPLAP